ncbi:MAG: flagellar basal body P-ring formation chaperone FlgA [Hyphomicrobiaceae bacterium]
MAAGLALVPAAATAAGPGATAMPVPTVTILQGDVLAEELVGEERFVADEKALRNYFTSRQAVVGKVARRVLPKGHAIPINALREPHLFKEGERVVLVFKTGGLSIEASGVALQPGVLGSQVNVRNADTGVVIRGLVQSNGSVKVGAN